MVGVHSFRSSSGDTLTMDEARTAVEVDVDTDGIDRFCLDGAGELDFGSGFAGLFFDGFN